MKSLASCLDLRTWFFTRDGLGRLFNFAHNSPLQQYYHLDSPIGGKWWFLMIFSNYLQVRRYWCGYKNRLNQACLEGLRRYLTPRTCFLLWSGLGRSFIFGHILQYQYYHSAPPPKKKNVGSGDFRCFFKFSKGLRYWYRYDNILNQTCFEGLGFYLTSNFTLGWIGEIIRFVPSPEKWKSPFSTCGGPDS